MSSSQLTLIFFRGVQTTNQIKCWSSKKFTKLSRKNHDPTWWCDPHEIPCGFRWWEGRVVPVLGICGRWIHPGSLGFGRLTQAWLAWLAWPLPASLVIFSIFFMGKLTGNHRWFMILPWKIMGLSRRCSHFHQSIELLNLDMAINFHQWPHDCHLYSWVRSNENHSTGRQKKKWTYPKTGLILTVSNILMVQAQVLWNTLEYIGMPGVNLGRLWVRLPFVTFDDLNGDGLPLDIGLSSSSSVT